MSCGSVVWLETSMRRWLRKFVLQLFLQSEMSCRQSYPLSILWRCDHHCVHIFEPSSELLLCHVSVGGQTLRWGPRMQFSEWQRRSRKIQIRKKSTWAWGLIVMTRGSRLFCPALSRYEILETFLRIRIESNCKLMLYPERCFGGCSVSFIFLWILWLHILRYWLAIWFDIIPFQVLRRCDSFLPAVCRRLFMICELPRFSET